MKQKQLKGGTEQQVLADFRRLTKPGSGLLLAVSGGSDSTGLAFYSASFAKKLGLKLAIGFVDHGLRKGVDREFALVEQHALRLGIPVHYTAVAPEDVARAKSTGSIQGWAREVRYAHLAEMAETLGMDSIATGHTRDDQAETVLLRIIRGTGLDGLAGIPEKRELAGGLTVIRPLLNATRQDIRTYLGSKKATWVQDPSNLDSRFLRVRVRRELLPLMNDMQPCMSDHLAALASDADAVTDFLDAYCIDNNKTLNKLNLGDGVKVDYEQFNRLPKALWGRIIRLALRSVRGDLRKIERVHVEPIRDLIAQQKSTGILPLPEDVAVTLDRGSMYVFSTPLPRKPKESLRPEKIARGKWRICFDKLGVTAQIRSDRPQEVEKLEMRTRRPGDKLWNSKSKFKDVLIQNKIPRPYRDFIPVLAQENKIVSCPMLVTSRKQTIEVHWTIKKSSFLKDISEVG